MVLRYSGWLQEARRMLWASSPGQFAALQGANREATSDACTYTPAPTESGPRNGGSCDTRVRELLRWLFLFSLNPAELANGQDVILLASSGESRISHLESQTLFARYSCARLATSFPQL